MQTMLTTKLNYQRIMALNPTVYCTITNSIGQKFDLVEHPTKGDEYPVIIMYHDEKLAVDSEFWDTEDMESNSDYMPVYMYGDMHLAYELDEADLTPTTAKEMIADINKALAPKVMTCTVKFSGKTEAINHHGTNIDYVENCDSIIEAIAVLSKYYTEADMKLITSIEIH